MCGKQQLRTAGDVEYVLQRKKVKRINLRMCPDGTAAVSAPPWVPAEKIDQFVALHAEWVRRAREKAVRRARALAVLPPDAEQCRAVFAAADAVVWPLVSNALGNRHPVWQGSRTQRWNMFCCMSMCTFFTPIIRRGFGK